MRLEACSALSTQQPSNYYFVCNTLLYICYSKSSGILSQLGVAHPGALIHSDKHLRLQAPSGVLLLSTCTPAGVGRTTVGPGLSHCITTPGGLHLTGALGTLHT